jgi:hypothetical protein
MNSKRTYLRDAKGRFASIPSKPDDTRDFLKYMVLSALNYLNVKRGEKSFDFEHLINNPEMQGKDLTDPDNNEMIY